MSYYFCIAFDFNGSVYPNCCPFRSFGFFIYSNSLKLFTFLLRLYRYGFDSSPFCPPSSPPSTSLSAFALSRALCQFGWIFHSHWCKTLAITTIQFGRVLFFISFFIFYYPIHANFHFDICWLAACIQRAFLSSYFLSFIYTMFVVDVTQCKPMLNDRRDEENRTDCTEHNIYEQMSINKWYMLSFQKGVFQ